MEKEMLKLDLVSGMITVGAEEAEGIQSKENKACEGSETAEIGMLQKQSPCD